ncbi:MAG: hypothetical protein ACAI35_28310 [Candidatus Methylacidiphilales bacterium]|nr:hypothetical protein [Candidatus Methylacidiphilales bacterium]
MAVQHYYYEDQHGKWRGPVAYPRLATMHQYGELNGDTLIRVAANPQRSAVPYRSMVFKGALGTSIHIKHGSYRTGYTAGELAVVLLVILSCAGLMLFSAKSVAAKSAAAKMHTVAARTRASAIPAPVTAAPAVPFAPGPTPAAPTSASP